MDSRPDHIVRQEETGRAALHALQVSSAGPTTTVFRDDRRGWYIPQRRPTAAELVLRPPKVIYTVDTSDHSEQFSSQLPSDGEAFFFQAAVALVWKVQDAVAAVESGLTDPAGAYRPQVEEILRGVARAHAIEDSAAAERAMNHEFAFARPTAQGVVVIRCRVQLTLDDLTKRHVASRTLAERSQETRVMRHEAVKQDSELSLEEARLLSEKKLLATKHEQELAELRETHEQQLLEQRMRFYAEALAGGNLKLIALKLAGGGKDVDEVIGMILQQSRFDFEGAHGMLTSMIEQGLINRSQLDDILARVNTVMSEHLPRPPFGIMSGDGGPLPSGDDLMTVDATPKDGRAGKPDASASDRAPHAGDEADANADGNDDDEDADEDERS